MKLLVVQLFPFSSYFIPLWSIPLLSVLILPYHTRQGFENSFCPSGVPSKDFMHFFISAMRATNPSHLTLLEFIALKYLM
jgi:hypothetical protein